MVSDDGFWLDSPRKLGSNHAVDGYGALVDLIRSGRLNERQLRSLAGSLRSLEAEARDKAAEELDRKKRPWMYIS